MIAIWSTALMFVLSSHTQVDALNLRIDGIGLRMTANDVLALVDGRDEKATVIRRPCLSDYVADGRSVQPLENRDGRCMDVPRSPGVSIVTTISLNYPKDETALTSIERAAGEPRFTDGARPWVVAMWCFGGPCTSMDSVIGSVNSPPWLLVHVGAGLTLTDRPVQTASEAYVRKTLRAKHIKLEN